MVGLSILLEAQKKHSKSPKIISKITMIKPPSSPPPSPPPSSSSFLSYPSLPAISFLDRCFLCNKRLSPGKDIYMYRGDRAFCSVECRCRQIFMDEESVVKENCSASAVTSRRRSKAAVAASSKNRAGGLFAY